MHSMTSVTVRKAHSSQDNLLILICQRLAVTVFGVLLVLPELSLKQASHMICRQSCDLAVYQHTTTMVYATQGAHLKH